MRAPDHVIDEVLRDLAADPADERAWASFYDMAWPFIFANVYRAAGGDHAAAEDAAQTVFLQLVRYTDFSTIRTAPDLRAYLLVLSRRVSVKSARTRAHDDLADLDAAQAVATGSESEAAAERSDLLVHALRGLDPGDRELVRLVAAGWTRGEIARHLGISVNAATVRIHRLRQKLDEDAIWHQLRSSL